MSTLDPPGPPWVDDGLRTLAGITVEPPGPWASTPEGFSDPGAGRYHLEYPLGEGGTGVAFFATRRTDRGETPHVLKIFRPALLLKAPEIAEVSRRKEQTAMRRLNDRVPPSPYIVRMTDSGEIHVSYKGDVLSLPWIASEYVNGGVEGTTLNERLARALDATGAAFDPERTLRMFRCLTQGAIAIHEAGLIHRDIKPDNVLLCGFAETEIAKLTDFGVARAEGLELTFGPQPVGTIGYAAPEQLGLLTAPITRATDVFALGVLLYRMLTADEYFRRLRFAALASRRDDGPDPRPHLREATHLHPELAASGEAVDGLDAAIRKATSVRPEGRFPTPRALADSVEGLLRAAVKPETTRSRRSATRERLRTAMLDIGRRTVWTTRHSPGGDRVLRAVAWEPDGRALGVSSEGLTYWDGRGWFPVGTPRVLPADSLCFALRVSAGRYLVGGVGGGLGELSDSGWEDITPGHDSRLVFDRAAGNPDGVLVITATLAGAPILCVAERRAWRTAVVLPDASAINGVAEIGGGKWLLVGRANDGAGWVGVYDDARHAVDVVHAPAPRPLLAVASDLEGDAYAVGPQGLVVAFRPAGSQHKPSQRRLSLGPSSAKRSPSLGELEALRDAPTTPDAMGQAGSFAQNAVSPDCPWLGFSRESVTSERDISAVAIDPAGVGWATAQGRILKRITLESGPPCWEAVHTFDWTVPVVGILAAGGGVFAVTVDGGILEGRDERSDKIGGTRSGDPH